MILELIPYIHLSHSANNTTILPQFWITLVFNFSWEDCNTQEKFETMVIQNFGGVNKVHCGLCESSEGWETIIMIEKQCC